jgi:uncharacterized membrane protein YfcA
MLVAVLALGVLAGALTTIAGLGGGVLLVVVLALLWGPTGALATTALALLVGNAHRVWLFRAAVDVPVGRRLVAGLFPGALIGALLAVEVPEVVLRILIAVVVGLALARALSRSELTLPRAAVAPAAVVVGLLTATAGGAGLLLAPLLLASGLEDDRYVATAAFGAMVTHVGRVIGYGAGGLIDVRTLALAGGLAAALIVGTLLGRAARRRLDPAQRRRVELGTLAACGALAIAGIA